MAKEVVIDIDEQGNVTIEGFGYRGPECKQITAAIEAALGTVTSTTPKPEYKLAATQPRKATA